MLSYKSIVLITLLLIASALSAWSITDSYFGNRIGSMDARIYGMGGAGTYNNARPFGIADNPANLTLLKKNTGFSVGTLYNRNEDNRAIPLYNSFDNYVDDAVYSSNINFYDDYAGAAYYSRKLGIGAFGIGVYHKPRLNFDSNYKEEVRNNRNTDNDGYPELIALNTLESEGNLYQTGFVTSMGFSFGDDFDINLGFDYSLLRGQVESEKAIRWSDWAIATVGSSRNLPSLTETINYDLNGSQLRLGWAALLNSRLGAAMTYSPKTTLTREGDYLYLREAYYNAAEVRESNPIDEDYIMPAEIRFGINYAPRNVMRTVYNLDLEYVRYSEIHTRYDDQLNLYAGVEHHITNRIPFRLGFNAVNNYFFTTESATDAENNPITVYYTKKILTPMITAGSSVQLMKNLTADLGFGYTWREYEALDLFGDAYYNDKTYTGSSSYALWPNSHIQLANRGWENPDKVRENNISFNAGLSLNW